MMERSIILLMALAAVAMGAPDLNCANVADEDRQDCGYSGIDQYKCQNTGCCWGPLNPNPDNYPWCFYGNTTPTPTPPPTPLACDADGLRLDCGHSGTTASECMSAGCCWDPVSPNPGNLPWCFQSNIFTPSPTPPAPPPGTSPFSSEEVDLMMGYFLDNIDIQGSGGVVAAPDYNTPGGSYYYHWMRDAALSMRALMTTNNDTGLVKSKMEAYVQWVLKVQSDSDPNNIDVRVEPKFYIPAGTVYDGGWCRPQTDGPGLRAGTNSLFALWLMNNTSDGVNYVKEYLYTGNNQYHGGAIKYDLDWVANNWEANGCDLWEELQSTDFFWNRYNFRYGLTVGAMVADKLGDSSTANHWRSVASQIEPTVLAHYNGQFVYESLNREKDSAVICGFNDGYLNDNFLPPTDYRVSGTIVAFNDVFNAMFPINTIDTRNGLGGILYGRYEGDNYAGGNPWILSTAALAQLYYNGAKETLEKKQLPSPRALADFKKLFNWPQHMEMDYLDFAKSAVQAGDDILFRLRYHTEAYNFHMSEQLDKNTGAEMSAKDLTWSYATVLKAMHYRTETQHGLV